MDYLSRDMGPVVRMARPENPNEIDEFVNPLCTELDEIGSFQSYCIGHFEQEWVDGLGQMIAEGRAPLTEAPRVEDPTEMRHMNSGYIQRMEFSRLDPSSVRISCWRMLRRSVTRTPAAMFLPRTAP